MLFEIKHRFTNNVLFACEAENMREAILSAVKSRANLSGAKLSGADLSGANLSGANLSGANLYGADLSWANLSGEKIAIAPLSISGLYWNVLVSESYLKIGCQRHTHADWKAFTDNEISEMHHKAQEFWSANKSWLLSACKVHRKESLAYRKANPESKKS